MENVLITGATGMLASTLIKQMLKKNIFVTAIVRKNSKKIKNLPINHKKLSVVECDLDELKDLPRLVTGSFDTFYHFAWEGTYGDSRNDVFLQEKNVYNILCAVQVAHELGCKVFIGAGSQAEFGFAEGKLSDKLPKNPVTGYGIAKYTAGKLSALLCESLGMRHCWGRILSAYGPGDNVFTMVMSSIISLDKGEYMKFTKGEQLWDYIYSEDCANAFYLIGQKGKHKMSYTIGTGNGEPLKSYIQKMHDIVNPSCDIGIGEIDYYPNQVMELVADISELQKDTGFEAKISFEDGIKNTLEWYRSGQL